MKFKHFIITRFNLKRKQGNWKKDKLGNAVLTDQWFEKRLKIFNQYCLPSVIQQNEKSYEWLIYISSDTDFKYKAFFEDLAKQYHCIKILEADSYESFENDYCKDVLKFTPKTCSHVITTRLDNDDILHSNFIAKIQEQFNSQSYRAVNFLKLYMLNPGNPNKLYIDYQFSNHFVSLIEEIGPKGIRGCYSKGDKYWNVKGEVIQISDGPFCIETINDHNLLNAFRGFPVFQKKDFSAFQINQDFQHSEFGLQTFDFSKMSWLKYMQYVRLSLTFTGQTWLL